MCHSSRFSLQRHQLQPSLAMHVAEQGSLIVLGSSARRMEVSMSSRDANATSVAVNK